VKTDRRLGGGGGAKNAMEKSCLEVGLEGVTMIAGNGDFSEGGKGYSA